MKSLAQIVNISSIGGQERDQRSVKEILEKLKKFKLVKVRLSFYFLMFKFILCVSAKLQIDLKVSFQGLTIDMIAFYICLGIANQQARNKMGFKHLIKLLIETRMPCRIFCQIFG